MHEPPAKVARVENLSPNQIEPIHNLNPKFEEVLNSDAFRRKLARLFLGQMDLVKEMTNVFKETTPEFVKYVIDIINTDNFQIIKNPQMRKDFILAAHQKFKERKEGIEKNPILIKRRMITMEIKRLEDELKERQREVENMMKIIKK